MRRKKKRGPDVMTLIFLIVIVLGLGFSLQYSNAKDVNFIFQVVEGE